METRALVIAVTSRPGGNAFGQLLSDVTRGAKFGSERSLNTRSNLARESRTYLTAIYANDYLQSLSNSYIFNKLGNVVLTVLYLRLISGTRKNVIKYLTTFASIFVIDLLIQRWLFFPVCVPTFRLLPWSILIIQLWYAFTKTPHSLRLCLFYLMRIFLSCLDIYLLIPGISRHKCLQNFLVYMS